MKKVLIVDDEELIRETLQRILKKEGYYIDVAVNGNEAIQKFNDNNFDLVLLDINLPDIDGLEVLKSLKEVTSDILVIMITGYASVENAVKAMKYGAYDYVEKPLKKSTIKLIVKLALETQVLKKEVKFLQETGSIESEQINFIGESKPILNIKKQITQIANLESANVLITGESGTGKELIARSIHNASDRKDNPFVSINCAAIPHNLLESELFGYEKGAFTNAFNRKIGCIEEANFGTLFLDEIGDMPFEMQGKLLHFIENKIFRRVGGTKTIEVDVRIIAATNQNLEQLIEQGKFREDLFYRLNIFPIYIPPLRERQEDIIPIIKYYLNFFNKKYNKKITYVNEQVIERLKSYHWKGNVRELKNIIERIVILNNNDEVNISDLPDEFKRANKCFAHDFNSIEIPESGLSLKELETNLNRILIKKALSKADGNISKAAKLLKIPRETLRDRIKNIFKQT